MLIPGKTAHPTFLLVMSAANKSNLVRVHALHVPLVKESSPGNTQQMKVINNFRGTIKSPFINHLLIKSAFVSRGWMIVF